MKVPIEAYIGNGWTELLAMIGVAGSFTAGASILLMAWLRPRLVKFFPTKLEYLAEIGRRDEQHRQNTIRFEHFETQMSELATKHSLKGVEQKLITVSENQRQMVGALGELKTQAGAVKQSTENTERLMSLVLNHMLQRDPEPK